MSDSPELLVGIEFAGAGAHPASWRRDDSRAEEIFTGGYWADLVGAADRAGADLAFLPDTFGVTAAQGAVRGRLEAVGVAARLSAVTSRIGLIPTATVTHTEPFHVAKAIQSLDHTTRGRAGWQVAVSGGPEQEELFGRKAAQDESSLWSEADEATEVALRLWDSWEDDAEIRDVATGRFIDRDKLHYIDFAGEHFSVKGPSITPRSPQGRPPIAVSVDGERSLAFAAARADVVRISAPDVRAATALADEVRTRAGDRRPAVLLDVDVLLASENAVAAVDLARLDEWSGSEYRSNSVLHHGDPESLVNLLTELRGIDGVVLRPLALASTLELLTARVIPALRPGPRPATTVRDLLGLTRPRSRYATSH
ncbi:LLM class flavin-dependent oxidoreductase [Rhodococcus sp. Q]|uniref:LLM class flavin-dependent oxidoreductase n=1 Tax=Rhodococcus sp. Q TaxID=2502252 RepID=UPI0010F5D2B8|nr:LLM class flavin-dependent oxidoreductase [Rhodococcus sp. Q]